MLTINKLGGIPHPLWAEGKSSKERGEATVAEMVNLTCRHVRIEPGQSSGDLRYKDQEMVYYIASGYGQLIVRGPDEVDWVYPIEPQTAIWVPSDLHHELKNTGVGTLECVTYDCKL